MGNSFVACRRSLEVKYELDTKSFIDINEYIINPQKLRKIRNFKIDSQSLFQLNITESKTTYGAYLGQLVNNQRHGLGIQDYESTDERYIGQFQGNQIEGIGAFIYQNNLIYFGDWKQNIPNGIGVIFGPESVIYCGQFQNGHIVGNCIYITQNFIYHGQLERGQQNGLGVQSWQDSTVYRGEWQNGMMHGYGQLIQPNKVQYEGYFSHNLKEGDGIEHQIERGISYYGSFIGGLRGGFGIEVISEQQLQRAGVWVCGELNELLLMRNEEDENFQAFKQSNDEKDDLKYSVTLDEPKDKEKTIIRFYQIQKAMKAKILDKFDDKQFKTEIQIYEERIKTSEQYLLEQQKNADFLLSF